MITGILEKRRERGYEGWGMRKRKAKVKALFVA